MFKVRKPATAVAVHVPVVMAALFTVALMPRAALATQEAMQPSGRRGSMDPPESRVPDRREEPDFPSPDGVHVQRLEIAEFAPFSVNELPFEEQQRFAPRIDELTALAVMEGRQDEYLMTMTPAALSAAGDSNGEANRGSPEGGGSSPASSAAPPSTAGPPSGAGHGSSGPSPAKGGGDGVGKSLLEAAAEARVATVFGEGAAWTRVTNTREYPHHVVGRLANGCTGAYISSTLVLTAGHCLYNTVTNTWNTFTNVAFSPGQVDNSASGKPFGSLVPTMMVVSGQFAGHDRFRSDYDWGLLVLPARPSSLGGGYLGFASVNSRDDPVVTMDGYPQSKHQQQWEDTGRLSHVRRRPSVAHHHLDVEPGSSGAPMFDSSWHIRSVQSGHTPTQNLAVKLLSDVFDWLRVYKRRFP